MYEIYINEKIDFINYKKLIDFAYSKSDAFMCMVHTNKYDEGSDRYCDQKKFDNNTIPFLKRLNPFLIKIRREAAYWPATIKGEGAPNDVYVYKLVPEIKELLYKPKGFLEWSYPIYPEDPSFFKEGYCWFFTCSHEGYYIMYVNKEEFEYIKSLGIKYEWQEVPDNIMKMTVIEFIMFNSKSKMNPDEAAKEFNEMFQCNISDKCTNYEEYDININNSEI